MILSLLTLSVAELNSTKSLGPVLAIGCESDTDLDQVAHKVLYVPDVPAIYSPVPISVLLQLLAYYTAKKKGCSIDKPKNLAKSVTIE